MQRCQSCDQVFFPPARYCAHCGSAKLQWQTLSGRGRIWSWVEFHRPYFKDMPTPYIVVRVELDEGPKLLTNLVNSGNSKPAIGALVHVVFQATGELTLPQFELD